jgi:hypothetical protein
MSGEGATPGEEFRALIRIFLTRLTGGGRHAWIYKLWRGKWRSRPRRSTL